MMNEVKYLGLLLLAHFLTDFYLQPTSWVLHKRKYKAASYYLYIHAVIAGLLSFVLTEGLFPVICILIAVSHLLIDMCKICFDKKDSFRWFLADQALHILVIIACVKWLFVIQRIVPEPALVKWHHTMGLYTDTLWWILGYIIVARPLSIAIAKFLKQMGSNLHRKPRKKIIVGKDETVLTEAAPTPSALEGAGKWIGIFERLIAFTLILLGQFSAIGFLITAKSILRLREDNREVMEYIILGTLTSFGSVFLVGYYINYMLS